MEPKEALEKVIEALVAEAPALRKPREQWAARLREHGRKESWDMGGRYATEELLVSLLQTLVGLSAHEAREAVRGEVYGGGRPTPPEMQVTVFGSEPVAPDLVVGWPGKYIVAIEIAQGDGGAALKDAVMKTAFHTLLGRFDFAVLVFRRTGRFQSYRPTGADMLWLEDCRQTLKVQVALL